MTCSACSAIVEAALRAVPGVSNAVVSLLQQIARVEFDPVVAPEVPQTLAHQFAGFRCPPVLLQATNSANKSILRICSVPTAGRRHRDWIHCRLARQGRHQ
jgi:cation transport ATPase